MSTVSAREIRSTVMTATSVPMVSASPAQAACRSLTRPRAKMTGTPARQMSALNHSALILPGMTAQPVMMETSAPLMTSAPADFAHPERSRKNAWPTAAMALAPTPRMELIARSIADPVVMESVASMRPARMEEVALLTVFRYAETGRAPEARVLPPVSLTAAAAETVSAASRKTPKVALETARPSAETNSAAMGRVHCNARSTAYLPVETRSAHSARILLPVPRIALCVATDIAGQVKMLTTALRIVQQPVAMESVRAREARLLMGAR